MVNSPNYFIPKYCVMTEIFGTFILSKTDDAYKGEFFNNRMKSFSNEDVMAMETSAEDHFVGSFDTSWQETSGSRNAVLEIDKETDDIYILAWKDVRLNGELQNINFTGRGVKRNDLLVSVYSMNRQSF